MIYDSETFKNSIAWLSAMDADGTRYAFDLDVKRKNGEVSYCHFKRLVGADVLKSRVEELAKDKSVYSILLRTYNGTSPNASRHNPTKSQYEADYEIQVSEPIGYIPPTPPPPATDSELKVVMREEMQAQQERLKNLASQNEKILNGFMASDGLEGVDGVDGVTRIAKTLMDSRIQCERGAMEIENMRDKLAECERQKLELEHKVAELEEENDKLDGLCEELDEQVRELKRYDVNEPGGIANMAVQVGSLTLGNIIKGYAQRNPARVAGLFGMEAVEMLGGVVPEQTAPQSTPQPEAYRSPRVPQIISWVKSLDLEEIEMLHFLVKVWDEDSRNLRIVYEWATGAGQTAGVDGELEEEQDQVDEQYIEQED